MEEEYGYGYYERQDRNEDNENGYRTVSVIALLLMVFTILAGLAITTRAFKELSRAEVALEQSLREIERKNAKLAEYEAAFEGVPSALNALLERDRSYREVFALLQQEREYYKARTPKEERWVGDEPMDKLIDEILNLKQP